MTTTLTPARLAELDALYAAMTPGCYSVLHSHQPVLRGEHHQDLLTVEDCNQADENADAFVALHNDYPALAAALRAAWAEADRIDDIANKMDSAAHAALKEIGYKWAISNWGEAALEILPDEARKLAVRVAELEAELATARTERDQWRTYAHDVEGGQQCIAEILTGESNTGGIVHRVQEVKTERDTLAARLREAVELLRPLAATADWDDDNQYARAAAAFIASEAAK